MSLKGNKLPADLTLSGSESHRGGPVAEEDLVPVFVLTLEVTKRSELDDQRCLGLRSCRSGPRK